MIRSDLEGRKMKYAIEAPLDVTVFSSLTIMGGRKEHYLHNKQTVENLQFYWRKDAGFHAG